MFKFLKSADPKHDAPPSVEPVSATPNSSRQRSNIQRELIPVVLKDTLRLHGIPSAWVGCEVNLVERTPGEEELHIQLIVMKWNEQLLRYAPALQQQLLLGLDRFDPSVDHSKYIVSWRFSPDCGCPSTKMPDPKFWHENVVSAAEEEPVPVLDRRHSRRAPNAAKPDAASPATPNRPSTAMPSRSPPQR